MGRIFPDNNKDFRRRHGGEKKSYQSKPFMSRRLKVKSARNGSSPPRAISSGNPFPAETTPSPRWLTIAVCLFLAAAVWAVFGQTRHHEFLNFDDNLYVYENPAITQGLTGD